MKIVRMLSWVAVFSVLSAASVFSVPTGGVFIPRNGGYEGWIGGSHVFIDRAAGGTLSVTAGEAPNLKPLVRMELVFMIRKPGSAAPVSVRQSFDKSPEVIIVEEGNDRIGVRIKFRLYDEKNVYHGYGMTEGWFHPDGTMYLDAAASFDDSLAQTAVTDARIAFDLPGAYATAVPGTSGPGSIVLSSLAAPKAIPFTDAALPGRAVTFSGGPNPPLSIFWRTGKLDLMCWPARGGFDPKNTGAPSYFRWPTFLPQAFHGVSGGGTVSALSLRKNGADLVWLDNHPSTTPTPTFCAVFRLAAAADERRARLLVEEERRYIDLKVKNGTVWDSARNTCG